ncbi:MAG: cobalamin-binding protein [Burkholderiales bacterium]|nr:cobalamin-binding protein [Burkholderiales bacterium]
MFIGGFLVLPFCAALAQPLSVADDAGRSVGLDRPARRIVALAPALAELVFAAGAGARLVGVARHSDHPAAARSLPRVGDAARIDFEMIVALRPDLVLAWRSGNRRGDYERLARLGYPVYVAEPRRLADVPRTLRAIGALAQSTAEAGHAALAFERGVRELRERNARAARVRVFYAIWARPPMTVSGAHMISDVIALCGGENVFADAPQLTPAVSIEAVIAARPEAILGGASAGGEEAFRRDWRGAAAAPLNALPAFYIDPDLIQRQTPRVLEGAKAVCAALEEVRRSRR